MGGWINGLKAVLRVAYINKKNTANWLKKIQYFQYLYNI